MPISGMNSQPPLYQILQPMDIDITRDCEHLKSKTKRKRKMSKSNVLAAILSIGFIVLVIGGWLWFTFARNTKYPKVARAVATPTRMVEPKTLDDSVHADSEQQKNERAESMSGIEDNESIAQNTENMAESLMTSQETVREDSNGTVVEERTGSYAMLSGADGEVTAKRESSSSSEESDTDGSILVSNLDFIPPATLVSSSPQEQEDDYEMLDSDEYQIV